MPANVGEMFYTGEIPWHQLGLALHHPATVEEALRAGGLSWKVGMVPLLTADDPPSPVPQRKAIVRLDKTPGDEHRVLGVAHRGFEPLQNEDGALLFDAIFGQGRPVYHTGGYLGHGEVVWLLAALNQEREIARGDVVRPYALFANSHDGSIAIHIKLTTVRVVCQNTLAIALAENRADAVFRRAHQGGLRQHAEAAQDYFRNTLAVWDRSVETFTGLTRVRIGEVRCRQMLESLLPDPTKPRDMERYPGLKRAYELKLEEAQQARGAIMDLRQSGKGMDLEGSADTLWGLLNAVLEFVDHHRAASAGKIQSNLIGAGMDLKVKAFRLVRELAKAA